MRIYNIEDKAGHIFATITFEHPPTNKFEEVLYDNAIARCRDILQECLVPNRPERVRSLEYFGYYMNPDRLIMDDTKESN